MLRGSLDARSIADRNRSFGDRPMGGSLNCISGRYAKGYAGPRLRHCSRISADGSLLPGCRFGALSSGCERYIRNGLATPTPGGATATWYTRHGASAAKPMIRTCGIAPIWHLLNAAARHEICHCACGVGSSVTARNAIFQLSSSWRLRERLIISPN